jgi:nickel-type superoxide dismutase maturation protease
MLRVIRVTGESLSPEYGEGDYVVLTTIPFFLNRIRVGDVIVFRHPEVGVMIKKVSAFEAGEGGYLVSGMHAHSVDSRQFGPVAREAVIGKVIWHIPKPAK